MSIIVNSNITEGVHVSVCENQAEAMKLILANKKGFQYIIEDVDIPEGTNSDDLFEMLDNVPLSLDDITHPLFGGKITFRHNMLEFLQ